MAAPLKKGHKAGSMPALAPSGQRPTTTSSRSQKSLSTSNSGKNVTQRKSVAEETEFTLPPRNVHSSTESLLVSRTSVGSFPASSKHLKAQTIDFAERRASKAVPTPAAFATSRRKGIAVTVNNGAKDKQILFEQKKRDLRKIVLAGDFMNGSYDGVNEVYKTTANVWMLRQWQLLVFVSSTFTGQRGHSNDIQLICYFNLQILVVSETFFWTTFFPF